MIGLSAHDDSNTMVSGCEPYLIWGRVLRVNTSDILGANRDQLARESSHPPHPL